MCMHNVVTLAVINQNMPVIKTNPEMLTFFVSRFGLAVRR